MRAIDHLMKRIVERRCSRQLFGVIQTVSNDCIAGAERTDQMDDLVHPSRPGLPIRSWNWINKRPADMGFVKKFEQNSAILTEDGGKLSPDTLCSSTGKIVRCIGSPGLRLILDADDHSKTGGSRRLDGANDAVSKLGHKVSALSVDAVLSYLDSHRVSPDLLHLGVFIRCVILRGNGPEWRLVREFARCHFESDLIEAMRNPRFPVAQNLIAGNGNTAVIGSWSGPQN